MSLEFEYILLSVLAIITFIVIYYSNKNKDA